MRGLKVRVIRNVWLDPDLVPTVERLTDLMFEVSNEDRLRILLKLEEEGTSVTGVSRELSLTTQEASRHLSRLNDVGLTRKDPDGSHNVTPYGRLVIKQIQGVRFASEHVEYFTNHVLGGLPLEFVYRMGELAGSTYIDDLMFSIHCTETVFREAEEYVWATSDQYPMSTVPLHREAFARGVKVRYIDALDWEPPQQWVDEITEEDSEAINKARRTGQMEERVLEKLQVYLWMNEKKVGILAFPTTKGRFDYLGFSSTDDATLKWCRDLYSYYWEKANPKTEYVLVMDE
jgi:predicted transcriptional regulator